MSRPSDGLLSPDENHAQGDELKRDEFAPAASALEGLGIADDLRAPPGGGATPGPKLDSWADASSPGSNPGVASRPFVIPKVAPPKRPRNPPPAAVVDAAPALASAPACPEPPVPVPPAGLARPRVAPPWPEAIPDDAAALAILRAAAPPPPELAKPHGELVAALSAAEKDLLLAKLEPESAGGLVQRGLVLQWRLSAALETRAAAPIWNDEAYAVLIAATSGITDELSKTAFADPGLRDAAARTRAELMRLAVAIGVAHVKPIKRVHATFKAPALPPIPGPTIPGPTIPGPTIPGAGTPRRSRSQTLPEPAVAGGGRRQRALLVMFAASALGAAVFHATGGSTHPSAPIVEASPGLPAGTTGNKDARSGKMVVRIVDETKRAAIMKELATYAEARNMVVLERAKDVFTVAPRSRENTASSKSAAPTPTPDEPTVEGR